MYYNGFFGVLKERNGKFEGYIFIRMTISFSVWGICSVAKRFKQCPSEF